MNHRVSRGTLRIIVDKCKGCELCIASCPPGVLSMSTETNGMGYRYPQLQPGCTACTACQLVCPDFVIDVYKYTDSSIADKRETGKGTRA